MMKRPSPLLYRKTKDHYHSWRERKVMCLSEAEKSMLRLRKQQCPELRKTLTVDSEADRKKLYKKHSLSISNNDEVSFDDDLVTNKQLLDGETEEDAVMRKEALKVRRRGSTVIQIPDATIQMDLHTLYLNRISLEKKNSSVIDPKIHRQKSRMSESDAPAEEGDKKSGPFTLFKNKSKRRGAAPALSFFGDFKDFLEYLRSNLFETTQNELLTFKGSHWTTIGNFKENMNFNEIEMIKQAKISAHERSRFEALWELFYAEVTYLVDNLLVLQDIFLRTLEHAKNYGFLVSIDEVILFGNLEALVKVTSDFATMLLEIFKECGASVSKSTEIIVQGFKEFPNLLTPQYREYCLNYQQAITYLKSKKKEENFIEFLKICENQERCARRQLEDLLVAPLQHLTKYPLLLKAIRKRTPEDDPNHDQLSNTICTLEESIKSIESTFSREVNMLRMKEINASLQWPLLADCDSKFALPEFIRVELVNTSHFDPLFENPDRILLHEGTLVLNDNNKFEVYVFLFSDIIIITKVRKKVKRPNTSQSEESGKGSIPHHKTSLKGAGALDSNLQYIVHKQPIPLDSLQLFDCDDQNQGIKTGFYLVQFNRFHQIVYLYTFQASSEDIKAQWIKNIKKSLQKDHISVAVTDCGTPNNVSSDEDLLFNF